VGYIKLVLDFDTLPSGANEGIMPIKDSVTRWFIQNIILPNAEDMRNPGYVLSKFTDSGKAVELREFFFPEKFYMDLETRIVKKLGKAGEKKLYAVGKRFGYRYALLSRYPKAGIIGAKKLDEFMYMFTRYIEVIYARELRHRLEMQKKLLELECDSYVGCYRNGIGYLLLNGAWTGVWSFILDDNSIDGVQVACQGRGDRRCRLVCAPAAALKERGFEALTEPDMGGLEEDNRMYEALNAVHPSSNNNLSMSALIESGIARYERGKLSFGATRMVGIEFSMYYLIDNSFSKDAKARKILYGAAYDSGREMGLGKDPVFVQRFLSGIGFGDVEVMAAGGGFRVLFLHFPWTSFSKKCRFTILSGFVSGLLSGACGKAISLKCSSSARAEDGFCVKLD
jgi:hypothetical protein